MLVHHARLLEAILAQVEHSAQRGCADELDHFSPTRLLDLNRAIQKRPGRSVLAVQHVHPPENHMCWLKIGIELDRSPQCRNGVHQLCPPVPDHGTHQAGNCQEVVCHRRVGLELDSALTHTFRLRVPVLAYVGIREPGVSLAQVRIQPNGLLQVRYPCLEIFRARGHDVAEDEDAA